MDELEEETPAPTKGPFMVTDRSSAEWALRKIASKSFEIDLVKQEAAALIESLEKDLASFMARYEPQLVHWAQEQLEGNTKTKTVKTLAGSIAFRSQPAKLTIASLQDAQTTARAVCPFAFKVEEVEKFDKWAFLGYAQEHFENTGEALPGLEYVPAKEVHSFKFASKENPDTKDSEENNA